MKSLSGVWLFATPWTVAYQAPQSMAFSRQEYWSGSPFPSPRALPDPGIEPESPALWADAFPFEPLGKYPVVDMNLKKRSCGLLASCGAWPPCCDGFSCCKAWALECRLSSCDTQLLGMWNLPGSGIKSTSLVGRFLSTAPPAMSQHQVFML